MVHALVGPSLRFFSDYGLFELFLGRMKIMFNRHFGRLPHPSPGNVRRKLRKQLIGTAPPQVMKQAGPFLLGFPLTPPLFSRPTGAPAPVEKTNGTRTAHGGLASGRSRKGFRLPRLAQTVFPAPPVNLHRAE